MTENIKIKDIIPVLKEKFENAVKGNIGPGILLSGGLDTSIVTAVASKYVDLQGVTVAFSPAPNPDVVYANELAALFGVDHEVVYFDQNVLYDSLREVVRILRCFDPMELRNSAAIYVGLKRLSELGVKEVMTGDAADELFAGYSFFFNKPSGEVKKGLENMWAVMQFSSIDLADALGLRACLPFTEPMFADYAKSLGVELKIGKKDDVTYGKWVLRKAYEDILPPNLIWRVKHPIEAGCGTAILPEYFHEKTDDDYFSSKKELYLAKDGVRIRDEEHLHYYEIYRSIYGKPQSSGLTNKTCPDCRSNVPDTATFCKICGAYPI